MDKIKSQRPINIKSLQRGTQRKDQINNKTIYFALLYKNCLRYYKCNSCFKIKVPVINKHSKILIQFILIFHLRNFREFQQGNGPEKSSSLHPFTFLEKKIRFPFGHTDESQPSQVQDLHALTTFHLSNNTPLFILRHTQYKVFERYGSNLNEKESQNDNTIIASQASS